MRHRHLALVLALVVAPSACGATASPPAAPPQQVNPDAKTQAAFLERVQDYLELRSQEEAKLPRLGDNARPEEIAAHQKRLYEAVRGARRAARPGDVFTPPIRALIRRLLAGAERGSGAAPRQAVQDENPGAVKLEVNGPYPTSLPLPTVPPQFLQALPKLPGEQLEYRFVGRRLILLDAKANLIVDYMERALP